MTIDLSTLQAGDRVKFRCGGEAEIFDRPTYKKYAMLPIIFSQAWGDKHVVEYFKGGQYAGQDYHPFDIIEIIPKPFDWKDAVPGMGVSNKYIEGEFWFVGQSIVDGNGSKGCVIIQSEDGYASQVHPDNLIRRPDLDIQL